jgi:signal transduction histidine kinase
MDELRATIRQLIANLRRICGDLRPPTLDSLGLGAAIRSYVQEWSERTGIALTLELPPDWGRLPEDTELSVFRIVQEGLRNVRKHSGASAATVRLEHTTPRNLRISICDNGRGMPEPFDLAELFKQGHYGLLGVSERVALLGGRLQLRNQPSGGLFLEVEIPHPRVSASA